MRDSDGLAASRPLPSQAADAGDAPPRCARAERVIIDEPVARHRPSCALYGPVLTAAGLWSYADRTYDPVLTAQMTLSSPPPASDATLTARMALSDATIWVAPGETRTS